METKLIGASTLKDWIATDKKVTVLDIRSEGDRAEWKIANSVHYNIIEKVKNNDASALDGVDLDKNIPVITVCNGGNASKIAANMLTAKGFDAYSLEGGMKAWNYAWDTAELAFGNVKIIQIRRLAKGCLSYLIGSDTEALVIDASLDPQVYQDLAKENNWVIGKVMDTHIHADYISRTKDLANATNAVHFMIESALVDYSYTPLRPFEEIKVGKTTIKVLHTPGHTWESTSFLIEGKVVFTGDTLFTDGIGRPDLKADIQESKRKATSLYESLKVLTDLEDNTLVLPAHISTSVSIGQDLISNRIDELSQSIDALSLTKDEFVSSTLTNLPDAPPNYLTIAAINKQGDVGDFVLADLEAGGNHCAIK